MNRSRSTVTIAGEGFPLGLVIAGILVITLGLAGFWVLANNTGAGDTETDDVRARFRSFVEAIADAVGDGACAMMTDETSAAFATRAAIDLGFQGGSCPEMVRALAAERSQEEATSLRGVEILEVRVTEADVAAPAPPNRAEVDIAEGTVVMQRKERCAGSPACWLISDGGPVFRLADPVQEGG